MNNAIWRRGGLMLLALLLALQLGGCGKDSEATAIADGPATEVEWDTLATLDLTTGQAGAALKALDGQRVKVPGFIVPLDANEQSKITELLLVPYFGACIHVPPPPPNQMVYSEAQAGFPGLDINAFNLYDPFWFYGTLSLDSAQSDYGKVSFRLVGVDKLEPYTMPMPEAPPLDPSDPDYVPPIDEASAEYLPLYDDEADDGGSAPDDTDPAQVPSINESDIEPYNDPNTVPSTSSSIGQS